MSGMTAAELRWVIDSDIYLSLNSVGIYAVDSLPEPDLQPGKFMVANSDIWDGDGLHWLTFYKSHSGQFEFFDSFGRHAGYYDERFDHFLNSGHKDTLYNTTCLQDGDSSLCGAYCIYYLFHRCRGRKMIDILSHFSSNHRLNDVIVKTFVDNLLIKHL
jgi:hypothetical protein